MPQFPHLENGRKNLLLRVTESIKRDDVYEVLSQCLTQDKCFKVVAVLTCYWIKLGINDGEHHRFAAQHCFLVPPLTS